VTRLAPLDLGIVAAYLLGMALVGAWFARSQKDLRAYFVGGRSAGWFLVLMSIVATETSAVTFLSVPGLGYREGGDLTFLQLALGYIVGRCLIAWFLLPQYMEGNLFSAYEVLRNRFSPAVQRVASGLFLLTRTLADGLRLYLTALLLQYVGFDIPTAIVVLGVVTVGYTLFGGMKAVLWTDLVQFSIKIAGAGLAGWYVVQLLPGGWGQLCEIGGEAGKFRAVDWKFDPASDANIWAGLVGGAVFSMASHGADQLMVQRYLCARSLGHARAALVLSGFVVFAQFVLFLFVGVGIYALRATGEFDPGPSRPDEVFGRFIVTALPTGAVGLLVAAVLAAAMSTLSSSLNSSANALVTDFYRPLRPGRSQGWYVGVSRAATAGWGLAQVGVAFAAYHFGGDDSIVKRVMAVAGLTTGLLLGLFVLGSLPRPAPSWAALLGLCIAAVTVSAVWVPPTLGLTPAWLGWPWYAPLGAGTTVGVALLAAAIGRPAAPQVGMTTQRFE
jgi:SSS family transporter